MLQPGQAAYRKGCVVRDREFISSFGNGDKRHHPVWANDLTIKQARMQAMDIDWNMTIKETSNAIPPAYTEYIGRYFLK